MAELFLGGAVDAGTHQASGTEIRLGTDLFTTHGVIVGMTGSGKTGLGVVLVEEVLRPSALSRKPRNAPRVGRAEDGRKGCPGSALKA